MKVLIIDDDAGLRKSLTLILGDEGYEVLQAEDGEQGLAVAREQLRRVPEVSLVAENAEQLPYRDAYFDVVTSTYLFRELPRRARRGVMGELHRVLRPGGLLVLGNRVQLEVPTNSPATANGLELYVQGLTNASGSMQVSETASVRVDMSP